MQRKKSISRREGRKPFWILFPVLVAAFLGLNVAQIFAQSDYYEFTLNQRRMGDRLGVELWVRSTSTSVPKLGSFSYSILYNHANLTPAALTYNAFETDSVDYDADQQPDYPYREITSPFHAANGYGDISVGNGSEYLNEDFGYVELEITFTGSSTQGYQPATTGKGTFVGRVVFDIDNHATLDETDLAGFKHNRTNLPDIVLYDTDGTQIDTSYISTTDPADFAIQGITILNPNGPKEVVNRYKDYESLDTYGYPIYFERSGLVNPSSYQYGTDYLAYAVDYSLDGGTTWTTDEIRFAEYRNAVATSNSNYSSGQITTADGSSPGYIVTKGDGNQLPPVSGDGYGGILRIVWDDDQYFPYRSEEARLRIVQLETSGTGADIDNRDREDIYDISDFDFILSRLFFVQLNGTDQYFKSQRTFSNPTQITVEAWINLNEYGADGDEPAIVASSAGPNSPEEGAWMLYLEDGKYPAFRAREFEGRGTDGYIASLVSPDALTAQSATFNLANDSQSDAHANNWTHIAGVVKDDSVRLYVDGRIVAEAYNDNAVDIRMSQFEHPIWIGVNPNPGETGITEADFVNMGVKEVRVWRMALTQEQILENVGGVYDPAGATTAINPTIANPDVRSALELLYDFQGTREDEAYDQLYQNGINNLDYYDGGSIANDDVNYRPDRAHVKVISPAGGEGVRNLENETFLVQWVGYGLGSIATGGDDLIVEFKREGETLWEECADSTDSPGGYYISQVAEFEDGMAIWEPYNNITAAGDYADLQGVGNTIAQNYMKKVYLRIRGYEDKNQDDIYDESEAFWVAPNFAVRNEGNGYIYVPEGSELNMSTGVTYLESWIKPYRFPTESEEYFPIVSKTDGDNIHYSLRLLPSGRLSLTIGADGGNLTAYSDASYPLSEPLVEHDDSLWTHVGVYVNLGNGYSQSDVRFYIDGTPQYADSISQQLGEDVSISVDNEYKTYFGYEPGATDRYFVGEMREARFWSGYPGGMEPSGTESRSNPTDMTKFIQGAQGVHTEDLLTTPTNYQDNLVAAFDFNGGAFVNNGRFRAMNSTDEDIYAYAYGSLGLDSAISFYPTFPTIKVVEPILRQAVPNSTEDLRVRWVGFDYDAIAFEDGQSDTTDLEYSIDGGGGQDNRHYEAVTNQAYNSNYPNTMSLLTTDDFRFQGVSGNLQYAAQLDVSEADPDIDDDGLYPDDNYGPIPAALTNARLRFRGRATINSNDPWEYLQIESLRGEGPLFSITPPSNFTIRTLLEGFHKGSNDVMNDMGDNFESLGLKISLYDKVGSLPGDLVVTQESASGYDSHASGLDPQAAPQRGTNGSRFANVPFVFTTINDGEYFVVVEHLNHLPVMSKYVANFQFSGDDLTTWDVESGWDFQSWGQNSTPTASDVMATEASDIYSGNGLFSAYGETQIDPDELGYDKTGLIFNQGQESAEANEMSAMVAGDVYRDGQINSSDRIRVRNDVSSNEPRSDVTGDGRVNALDRQITDRNFNKISSLVDLSITVFDEGTGKIEDRKMFPYMSDEEPLAHVSNLDPVKAEAINEAATEYIEGGKADGIAKSYGKKGELPLGGVSYKVMAMPEQEGGFVNVALYVQNTGAEFAPGNCTFAITYETNKLEFAGLIGAEQNIFSDDQVKGYDMAYSAPLESTPNPVANVRTIEIDYDGYTRKPGTFMPFEMTYLGTLTFEKKAGFVDEFNFEWHPLTIVLATDGTDVTNKGEFIEIKPINIVRNVTLKVPNGGESWRAGRVYTISWNESNVSKLVHIEYSIDGASSWNRITDVPVDVALQSYNWITPQVSSDECLVRIVDADTGVEDDRSDAFFSIMTAPVAITRPSSADPIYVGGSNDFIRWEMDDAKSVYFEFSENGVGGWVEITPVVSGETGEVAWILPVVNTKKAYVRMMDAETGELLAQSEPFRVLAGTLDLMSPGAVVNIGERRNVRWTYDNVSRFDLQFSPDGGLTWETLARDVNALSAAWEWIVPNLKSDNALLRALWNNDPDMEYSRTPEFKIDGTVNVDDVEDQTYAFDEPIPNPFTGETKITFTLPFESDVYIDVYDSRGMVVANLVKGQMFEAGVHTVTLYGNDLPAGLYFIHLNAGSYNMTRQAVHVK